MTQPAAKETERFWTKMWQPNKNNEKSIRTNTGTRELEGLEAEIHINLLKTTQKYQTGKRQAMMENRISG